MRRPTSLWIFVAMVLGIGVGLALHGAPDSVLRWFQLIGSVLFIGALKMIIAPLILCSIVAGITSIPTFSEAGRIGLRALAYYAVTTTVAVAIGLALVLTLRPGDRAGAADLRAKRTAELEGRAEEYAAATGQEIDAARTDPAFRSWLIDREARLQGETPHAGTYRRLDAHRVRTTYDMFLQDIVGPLLMNPFRSLSERNSLGIILWSLLLGLAIMAVGGAGRPLVELFHAGNAVMLRLTGWIMRLAPLAIFCLMVSIVAEHGLGVFHTLGWYCATVVGGIGLHVLFLLALVALVGGMSPRRFLGGIREAWAVAFATRSSAATLPVTVRCVVERLGVSPRVAHFTLPVGATVNMDGTALYEGVAVIFLLQIYGGMGDVGIALTAGVTLVVFVTAVLASIGAAAVPDAGLVTMVLVASAVHLPVYYIPILFTVDALLDMFRTSTNVMGDAAGAVIVDRFERRAAA